MKEENNNIFEAKIDYTEEVPYMNNDGDILQDSIKEIKKLTENIQGDFLSKNNVVEVDFGNKKSNN